MPKLPAKKFCILTSEVSSVFPEFIDELDPPDGLLGTCSVLDLLRCFSSKRIYVQLFGTFTTQRL